ncbi:uncharacterized protein FFB20_13045 [Fusarium fujikuroi]|nr:uncharacterized protein FFB20_13045 [Fusarium fujikuroi]SCO27431.1 uncharacterized protein FFMR_00311 [Fusarium fujikuroi]
MAEENRDLNPLDSVTFSEFGFPGHTRANVNWPGFNSSSVPSRAYLIQVSKNGHTYKAQILRRDEIGSSAVSDTEVYQVLAPLFFNRYLLQEEAPREEPCLVVFQDTPEATVLVDRPSIAEFISQNTSAAAKVGGADDDFEEGVEARDNQSLTKTSPGEALPNTGWDMRCIYSLIREETPGCTSPPSLYKYTVYSSGYGIREGLDYLKLDNMVSTTKDVQSHLLMFGIDRLGAGYGWLRERYELSVTVTKVVKERLE